MKMRIQSWMAGMAVALIAVGPVLADEYWDINGANAGATDNADGTAPGNTSAAKWSTDSTGASTTHVWPGGVNQETHFSAGVNATGTYTVVVDTSIGCGHLYVDYGRVTLAAGGGAVNFSGANNRYWGANTTSQSLLIEAPVILSNLTGAGNHLPLVRGGGIIISGVISGAANQGVQFDGGVQVLTGLNTFDGSVVAGGASGMLSFNTVKNVVVGGPGIPSALGAPTTVANGTLSLNAGNILNYTGTGDTTDRNIAFAGTDRTQLGYLPTLRHSGTGILTWNGSLSSVNTVIFQLEGAGTGIFGGNISNSTGVGKSLGICKDGTGTWILSGNNTYQGPTLVGSTPSDAGVLRLGSTNALPGASNVQLQAGVLELGAGDFTNSLGTGAGQVQAPSFNWCWGGFSAYGGSRIVNLGGNGAMVEWGTNSWFNGYPRGSDCRKPLVFGSTVSDSRIDFQNPLNFHGYNVLIQVNDNPATNTDMAVLSGTLTNGALTKTGSGTLVLAASNTFNWGYYCGFVVKGGVVRLANTNAILGGLGSSGGACNIRLAGGVSNGEDFGPFPGGVIELTPQSGDFSRPLGDWQAQYVQWTGNGGFSAYGGNRTVNLGGASAMVTWNSGGFVLAGSNLIFGSSTADSQIEFRNPINLTNAVRTIQVDDNVFTNTDQALMSGVLSGTGGLLKTGAGKLVLGANETYAGATTVSNGTLAVNGSLASSGVTVNPLGTLGGTGTVGSVSVESGGTIAAGDNATGTLTVASLAAASNSVLRSYVQEDRICNKLKVNGTLDVSTLRLVVTGTMPPSGTLVLAEGAPVTNTFQNVDLTGLTDGDKTTILYSETQILLKPAARGSVISIW